MAFKDELRRLRRQDGLTQAELAVRIGISKSTISMYECGNREPDFETLEAFADFFNVDMNQLTGLGSAPMSQKNTNSITPAEYSLVLAYRQASDADRQIIDNIVERYRPVKKFKTG